MPLHITNLSKRIGNNWVLRDVTFDAGPGRIFGIFGPSGSGKSTLLKTIAGKLNNNGGSVAVDGKDVNHAAAKNRGITYHSSSNVQSLISIFGDRKTKLSSGERELLDFEKAVTSDCHVLLLDDPFSQMDAQTRATCLESTRREAQSKVIVFASSDFTQILQLADDAAVLVKGEIVQIGEPQEVYNTPETAAIASITGENNVFAARRLTSTNAELPEFQTIDGGHRIFGQAVKKSRLGAINQNVMLAIRPEQVVISAGASFPEDNLLKAIVTDIKRLGPTSLVEFDAGGLCLKARVFRVVGLEVGDECMLSLPPERILVLKD